ncbi:SDR family NAD(P)-dependent oxidoreductase [Sphingomonas aerolata]|jgi:NAD(P)-dependent dehydrogenase (short-subunit alcohol dehydrogenase family)|uniref:SDR family NAD(P)-dependent oxidoreductase n=1 Tax=Sphingomonas aerolata TaxID=185951 RepID=UPI002FE0FE6D
MHDLAGKCAVVTGAGSGIGAALVHRLAREGMNVVLADVSVDEAQKLADTIGADRTLVVRCDVSDPDAVEALAVAAEARFGPVALLCNNAGIVPGGRHRKVWEYSPNDWQWSIGVNLYGVINGIRSFVPRMIAHGGSAHVLNTASVAGFVSGSGSACYGAAKHAVVRVTEALLAGLREEGVPIGVTLLAPGLVRTRIYEAERVRPGHLADAGGPPQESAELDAMRDDLYRGATTAEETADLAIDAVIEGHFYVFTTEAFDAAIRRRCTDIVERADPQFESIVAMSRKDSGLDAAG